MTTPFTPQPAPWSCLCGVDRNSALVDECPVCHTKRPYEYTAPEPVLAVPADYPQPGESMEEYAKRMKEKPGHEYRTNEAEIATAVKEGISVDAGRARELPDPSSIATTGYFAPIQFAGPVGSVEIDPGILQLVLDVVNKAAATSAVRSVTVGLKNPGQARLVVRADFDLSMVQYPRVVKDDG